MRFIASESPTAILGLSGMLSPDSGPFRGNELFTSRVIYPSSMNPTDDRRICRYTPKLPKDLP